MASAGGFFQRWSRLKQHGPGTGPAEAGQQRPVQQAATADACEAGTEGKVQEKPLPTLADVGQLHAGSDYAAFMAPGVDSTVRRQAMKKLFTEPHFNTMDGLDIYIGDYTRADPVSAAMLASLQHANTSLGRLISAEEQQAPDAAAGAQDALKQEQHAQGNAPENQVPEQNQRAHCAPVAGVDGEALGRIAAPPAEMPAFPMDGVPSSKGSV